MKKMSGKKVSEKDPVRPIESLAEKLLTSGSSVIKEDSDTSGADSMPDDPRLEKAFDLIRQVIAAERQRTIDDILRGVKGGPSPREPAPRFGMPERSKGQRAPAGSARLLCERTLTDAAERGLTTNKIHDLAETEYEQMLSISAIRNELSVGEKAKPPLYKNVGGVWYLAKYAPPSMRVVGQ